jgi:hypothetical protein
MDVPSPGGKTTTRKYVSTDTAGQVSCGGKRAKQGAPIVASTATAEGAEGESAPSSAALQVAMEAVEKLTNETIMLRRTNAEQAAIREVDDHVAHFSRLRDQTSMLVQIIRLHNGDFVLESTIAPPVESQWLAAARVRVDAAATEALGGMRLGYE